jgi:hypothetical protein
MPARVHVTIGAPIDISRHYDEPLTAELQSTLIRDVMRQVARLGGHENYEPTLAGRHWKPQFVPGTPL